MIDTLKKIQELIEQNRRLEQRNEEIKNIIDINLNRKRNIDILPIQELIGKTEIESLVFKFYQKYKIPGAIFLKDSGILFSIGTKRICMLHQQSKLSGGHCCSEMFHNIHLYEPGTRYFHLKCLSGFSAITFPIVIRKKHIATLVFSQFFYEHDIPDFKSFRVIAQNNNLSDEILLNLLSEVPVFSKFEIDEIINQGILLADMISFVGGKNLEFYEKFKFQINNELLLKALKEKITEQELIIKSLTNCINAHFKDVKENTIDKSALNRNVEKLNIKFEQTERLLNTILTSIPLGIIFIKKDVITYANDQIFRITGYTTKELIGRNPVFVLPEFGLWEKLNQLSSHEFVFKEYSTFKTTIRSKSQGIQNVVSFISPFEIDKPTDGYIMSFLDSAQITNVQTEDAYSQTSEQLPLNNTKYDWSKKTILIAEDEELNYIYIQKLLSPTKVKIKWAENGQKAVDTFNQDPNINLVLMDIKMPVLNGIEATKIIKAQKKQIPVIAQTAYAHEINKDTILKAGCDEFIPKPINSDIFIPLLEKFLS
jgi:PAS domain S-box-containing protein